MKKLLTVLLALLLVMTSVSQALACTGFAAGKKVTEDGSLIFGRTEDIGGAYNKVFNVNPATTGEGTVTLTDPYNGYTIDLPAEGLKWTMVNDVPEHDDGLYAACVTNEHGVSLTATVSTSYNEAAEKADPLLENGLREAYLPNVVIPYVKTAKEGVLWLGEIVEKYGAAECNTVIFGDKDEAWVMEIVSGHQWAAAKVPDDKYAVIPNCMMLGWVDLDDPENYLGSKDLFELPKKEGFLKEHNGKPHVALTWGSEMSAGNRVRAWGGQHFLSPSQQVPHDSPVFELFMTPDKAISLTDAMKLMAYRYEGTEYDVNQNPTNRAIGTERTAEAHLFQYREALPALQWLCMGNPEHTVFLPSYLALNQTPDAFQVEGEEYNPASAYWTFRTLSGFAEIDRVQYGQGVKDYWAAYQKLLIEALPDMDKALLAAEGAQAEAANALFAALSEDALADAKAITDALMFYHLKRGALSNTPKAPFAVSLTPEIAKLP